MIKVLIVDDSRTSRRMLRAILEEIGYEVVGEFRDKFTANGTLLLEYGQKISLK